MICVEVPGEARPFRKKVTSWNARDGRSGTHAYDEKLYADWKNLARMAAARAMGGRPPLPGPVDFKVNVYFAIPASWSQRKQEHCRRGILRPVITPDYDNLAKACADALTMIVFRDDKQIVHAEIDKWYGDRPRVEMVVDETILAGQRGLPLAEETG